MAVVFLMLDYSAQAANTDQGSLQNVIDMLDVTSFNNSVGPRREKGKITFNDYGASNIKLDGKRAVLSYSDNSWAFTVSLLDSKNGQTQICFEDQAKNGGSYHTQDAYLLTEDKTGWLKASVVENESCPSFAK